MHDRKEKMAAISDCFIALPGGVGTLEEIIEVFVWTQLNLHKKACGILNVNGYYDPLLELLETMSESRFLKDEHRKQLLVGVDPVELLDEVLSCEIEVIDKWMDRDTNKKP